MVSVIVPEPGLSAARPTDPDTDDRYEIIDGRRVELPPMSALAQVVASKLVRLVGSFADAHGLGEMVGEVLFALPDPVNRNRRPDAAFVSYQRFPRNQKIPADDNAWDVVPDLAVEVVSPNDLASAQWDKVIEYFRAGVRLVWVVYPDQEFVFVHDALTQVRVLSRADTLDGGAVLPGLALPLATLFAASPATPPSPPGSTPP